MSQLRDPQTLGMASIHRLQALELRARLQPKDHAVASVRFGSHEILRRAYPRQPLRVVAQESVPGLQQRQRVVQRGRALPEVDGIDAQAREQIEVSLPEGSRSRQPVPQQVLPVVAI